MSDKIYGEVINVLSREDYVYDSWVVRKIHDDATKAKAALIELFSHHPAWDEENRLIRVPKCTFTRKFDSNAIWDFGCWLQGNLEAREMFGSKAYDILYYMQSEMTSEYFNEDMAEVVEELNKINPNFHLRTNMKTSKAIGKICHEMGWDKPEITGTYTNRNGDEKPEYGRKYAALCDALTPHKQERDLYISLNDVDFLYMSNGTSWNSCHDIRDARDPGMYSSGTISYLLDPCSFVVYTLETESDKPYLEHKTTRQMFGYKDGAILQSRMYPQALDRGAEHAYEEYRMIIQDVIAKCLDEPNRWIVKKKNVHRYVEQECGATAYPDWEPGNPGSKLCNISLLRGMELDDDFTFTMGAEPICIECGCKHSVDGNINCCRALRCEKCGAPITEDEAYYIDYFGYACGECAGFCDDCDTVVLIDHLRTAYVNGREVQVCDSCLENNYYYCEHCGEYHHVDNIHLTADDCYLCDSCYESETWVCDDCGEVYYTDAPTTIGGREYCSTCARDHEEDEREVA